MPSEPCQDSTMAHATSPQTARCCPADELERGCSAVVVEVAASPKDAQRLSALGLCAGATFRVQSPAPLLRIELGGHSLALGPEWSRALRVVQLAG